MGEGRGSAMVVAIIVVLGMAAAAAETATYTVGGAGGWTFNVDGWTRGKKFKAGDTLVFSYSPGAHNVVPVNSGGYRGCSAPGGAKAYQTGKDRFTLKKGQNFFICSYPGHCQSGMKIAVTAS